MKTTAGQFTGRELRYLADNYEQAQRLRIETGERIRAVVQGRDETFEVWGQIIQPADPEGEPAWMDEEGELRGGEETIRAIQAGETIGPVPMLGRSHHRYWTEERETYRDMMAALAFRA